MRSPIHLRVEQMRKRSSARCARLDALGIFSNSANQVRVMSRMHSKVYKMMLEEEAEALMERSRAGGGELLTEQQKRQLGMGSPTSPSSDDEPRAPPQHISQMREEPAPAPTRLPQIGGTSKPRTNKMGASQSAPELPAPRLAGLPNIYTTCPAWDEPQARARPRR